MVENGKANVIAITGEDSFGKYCAVASLGEFGKPCGTIDYDFGSGVLAFHLAERKAQHSLEEDVGKFVQNVDTVRNCIVSRALDKTKISYDPIDAENGILPPQFPIKSTTTGEPLAGRPLRLSLHRAIFGGGVPEVEAAPDCYSNKTVRFGYDAETGVIYPRPLDIANHLLIGFPGRVLVASPFGVAYGMPDSGYFGVIDGRVMEAKTPISFRSDTSARARELAIGGYDRLAEKTFPYSPPAERVAHVAALAVNELDSAEENLDELTRVFVTRPTEFERLNC
jgi:hypothetical protein